MNDDSRPCSLRRGCVGWVGHPFAKPALGAGEEARDILAVPQHKQRCATYAGRNVCGRDVLA